MAVPGLFGYYAVAHYSIIHTIVIIKMSTILHRDTLSIENIGIYFAYSEEKNKGDEVLAHAARPLCQ
jgi:hypothetical protein